MHYPDPSQIVYPTTAPPRFPPRVTTPTITHGRTLYPVHDHCAFIDAQGEGVTDAVASHFHRVRNGRILPDQSDGHTHGVTSLPCGAG